MDKAKAVLHEECGEPVVPDNENVHFSCGEQKPAQKPPARTRTPRRQTTQPPPDMSGVIQVPRNPIRGMEDLNRGDEENPQPEGELHPEDNLVEAVDAVLEKIFHQASEPGPAVVTVPKPIEKEAPVMANNRASNFLRNLAATAKTQRAAYLERLTDIPNSVIILAKEVLPELLTARDEEDQERIKTLLEGLQQAKNEHAELESFIDLHNTMQFTKDPGLNEDFEKIVATARAMQTANEARNAGRELDDAQLDTLKSNLDTMAKKAMTDFNGRTAEAERERRRNATRAYGAVESMATHGRILDALEAAGRGEIPIIIVHIGERMPVPGLPNADGEFPLKTLGSRALTAWELVMMTEGTYRAYLKGQWGEVCFDKHIDPAVGEPGMFEFNPEFSLKATEEEQRADAFHVIRYICGRWVRSERIARQKAEEEAARDQALREAFQPYRDRVAPVLGASDFLIGQKEGTFYMNVTFTMGPKQPLLHLEAIFKREEENGGVSLEVHTTETTNQDRPFLEGLAALEGQFFLACAAGIVNHPDDKNTILVFCDPVGLRKALLDVPNDQKARLANLMRTQMHIDVQQETFRAVVDSVNSHRVAEVAKIAMERKVIQCEKQREKVQKMIALLTGPCAVLRNAFWQALKDET